MDRRIVAIVLASYLVLLEVTGWLSYFLSTHSGTPTVAEVKSVLDSLPDEKARELFSRATDAGQSGWGDLAKVAFGSFQIVIGAVVGFLSSLPVRAAFPPPPTEDSPH